MIKQRFVGHCDRCDVHYESEVPPIRDDWSEGRMIYLDDSDQPKAAEAHYTLCHDCTQSFMGWFALKGRDFYGAE